MSSDRGNPADMAALPGLPHSPARPHGSPSYGLSGAGAAFARSSRRIRASLPGPRYFPNQVGDRNYVRIYTMLRSREQYPGTTTMTTADKLKITDQLAACGVDVIEVGFPAFSRDFYAVQSIAKKIGNKEYTLAGGQSHVPVICGLARCRKEDVDAAWEALRHAQRPRINMFIPLDYCKLGMTPDEIRAIVKGTVAYACGIGCPDVQFTAEDAGSSDRGFLYHILEEVIKDGATTLNISDTIGHSVPDEFGKLIADIKANVPGIENVIISTHCRSYRGLATANTIAGACAGARQLEVAISGIGERAKNASLEEVVRAIEYPRRQLGGLYTAINSQLVNRINKMIKEYNETLIQAQIGTTGAHTFAQLEGRTHQVGSSSPTNDSDLRKKGFLSFINTCVGTLAMFYSFLNVFSTSYPGSQKALVSYDETLVKGIIFSNVFLWCGSFGMLSFASLFKDGESIDHVGFDIFIGVLFLWMLFLIAAYCITLNFFLQIPLWVVCPFGVGVFFIIELPSILYIERQRPVVRKWGKNLWRKLRGCFAIICAVPGCFSQALQFFANMSCAHRTGEMEDDNGAVLSEMERGNSKLECFAP